MIPAQHPLKVHLLCLSENPTLHEALFAALRQCGCTLVSVTTPDEAVAEIKSTSPTLLLLDTIAATEDMYALGETLITHTGLENISLIVLAESSTEAAKVRAFGIGAVAFLTIPILPQEILAMTKQQANLEALREQYKFLPQELDDFLATATHNIRNPLGATISYAEYLKKFGPTMSAADIQKDLNVIASNGYRINRILDELRLLLRIRTEPATSEPLDMITIIFKAQERLERLIETYQAEIVLAPHWPEALGDYDWIEEVWVNYLGNALKHGGRPPRVELGSTVQADGMIQFWIHDNGAGLTFAAEEAIFPELIHFSQAKIKGDGMGLPVVRYIVEKLGGWVSVESAGTVEGGSTFSFYLPPSKNVYHLEDDL